MSIYSELIKERCLVNVGQRILAEEDPMEERRRRRRRRGLSKTKVK